MVKNQQLTIDNSINCDVDDKTDLLLADITTDEIKDILDNFDSSE